MLSSEIGLDEALFMLSSYKLGCTGYTNFRQELKSKVDLPAYYRLMQHKNSIMPEIVYLSDPLSGVSLRVKESMHNVRF